MRTRGLVLPLGLLLTVSCLGTWAVQPFRRSAPVPPPAIPVDSRFLRAHVEAIVAIHPRSHAHPQNLERAAAYIEQTLIRLGHPPVSQRYRAGGERYRNLLVRLGPVSGPRVVVGAHYDACGATPGADDNASGVAGVLELARVIDPAALAVPVELAFWPLEEPPNFRTAQMGSVVHARALRQSGDDVKAMISVEMIGYYDDTPGSQQYPVGLMALLYPTRGNFISVVSTLGDAPLAGRVKAAMRRASGVNVVSLSGPRWIPGVDYSDHLAFLDEGWPAVMVTDTAFNRSPHYHEASDTPDTLDYERMADVVTGLRAAVLRLASD